ncbi:MAG TPA: hypothetical protein VMZ53_16915 [Kofleriaceae bacterium]|nr:hypothetical protein [Kofleriaceae bacterium]
MSRQLKIIVGAIVAVVLGSVAVAVFVMRGQSSESSSETTVRIEVRALPQMTITKDGKTIGKTPLSFVVPKSTKPISLDATWTEQRIYKKGGEQMVPREAHKDVVPDRTQAVDFSRRDGKPVPPPMVEPATE